MNTWRNYLYPAVLKRDCSFVLHGCSRKNAASIVVTDIILLITMLIGLLRIAIMEAALPIWDGHRGNRFESQQGPRLFIC